MKGLIENSQKLKEMQDKESLPEKISEPVLAKPQMPNWQRVSINEKSERLQTLNNLRYINVMKPSKHAPFSKSVWIQNKRENANLALKMIEQKYEFSTKKK